MRNISIYFFIIFLFHSELTLGWQHAEPAPETKALQMDTARVKVRGFSNQKIQEFQGDSDFNYGGAPKLKSNLWQRIIQWILDKLGNVFQFQGVDDMWAKIVFYTIIAGIIIYAILKLANVDISKVFYKLSDQGNLDFNVSDEDIHQMDFEALIEEAINQKEYKKAIRLYYLYALKKLADRDLISWKPGKTNHEYQQELRFAEIRPSFGDLSYYFEYAWYGDFPINENMFAKAKVIFRDFKTILDKA
ncbi:DUF4129 domain-containing protein [Fulvivirgaceae bacterium BMA12]|uniref:DUF4129 domain-containing protein n=1 Tax=Agaribacillus aureus TaxID=3051825 RepID=A0ABT8L614_9BACT|nr:DUF4129 domain-containing protein [Fulvivirgaceae bacterium BMA12]